MRNRSVAATALLLGIMAAACASMFLPHTSAAQAPTGRIVGRIIDRQSGLGIADVGVQVVGTTSGVMSGVDGRYTVSGIPAGTVSLHVRRIGYQPKTITALMLPANGSIEQDVALDVASVQLQTLTVTASAERGTVNEALDRQRTATGIVSAITAEQIARSPDGDAAAAMQRVSGVTVQDGRYVFVRGLGERYTTTSLNGARVPSPEPERKVVPLDLFPASLLQTVTTSKTFTPDQSGDFSGAQVDIQTREFPARRTLSYSMSMGYNDAASGSRILSAPSTGAEWIGFGGDARKLPSLVRQYGNFNTSISQPEYNQLVRSFRNSWSADNADGRPNYSMGASIGGEDPIFKHPVGYIGSLSYSYGQEVRHNEERAQAVGGANGETRPFNAFRGSTGRTSILWGGLLNLSTWVGKNSKIALNNTYNRTADNEARQDSGFYDLGNFDIERTLLRYVERSVLSNQLRGDHVLGTRHTIDWSVTSARVSRVEPDRSNLTYGFIPDVRTNQPLKQLLTAPEANRRTFGDLEERNFSPSVNYKLALGPDARQTFVKVGALYRDTRRDADTRSFSIIPQNLTEAELAQPAEDLFERYSLEGSNVFRVEPYLTTGSYRAEDRLSAAYLMADHPFGDRIRAIAGARVEHDRLDVTTLNNSGAEFRSGLNDTDVLPSVAINLNVTESQNLRLSASQTLSRPEYRELSPLLYQEAIGEDFVFGDTSLTRALIQNYDLRWEWYPKAGEVLSVALFAKRFSQPIERVYVASSGGTQISFVNADGAENYGVELEVRKGLGALVERLTPLTVFANGTIMKSDIRPGNEGIVATTRDNRPMVGQSPFVVNAGMAYSSSSGKTNAAVLYNVAGKRIFAAGVGELPDSYEQARHALDLTISLPVWRTIAAKIDLKNLLDYPYEITQGEVTRERYTAGRVFSAGLSWRP
ncbi:MAG: TonB-dependent receptor [Gemmatimonadaceae bacterium]|nr:TonB-dependent receptor [Gemmatimonadaceae bacterium]